MSIRESLQHDFQFVEALVWRIDEHQPAALIGRQKRLEGRIPVADFSANAPQGLNFTHRGASLGRHQLDEEGAVLRSQAACDESRRSRIAREALAASCVN